MTNINKACEECRIRKIRCEGGNPCCRCSKRNMQCVYRFKVRNRLKKPRIRPASLPKENNPETSLARQVNLSHESETEGNQGFHVHSIAALPMASYNFQLHYGPSSNFSIMHLVSSQISGVPQPLGRSAEVAQVGPGLDLFEYQFLFFGDLADSNKAVPITGVHFTTLPSQELSNQLLERYLSTYWHMLPIVSKEIFRQRLAQIYVTPGVCAFDSLDGMVVLAAMAVGASMMGEEKVTQMLFQGVKANAKRANEYVNIQSIHLELILAQFRMERSKPHSGFMHVGNAARKAIAAGLHRGVNIRGKPEDASQRRLAFWSDLKRVPRWVCFILGRQTSISELGLDIPVPADDKIMAALVKLTKIVSHCADRIYNRTYESLVHMWDVVNEIRGELHEFADEQRKEIGFEPDRRTVYMAFFLEGACFVLGFDMLSNSSRRTIHLPYMQNAVDCLSTMIPKQDKALPQVPILVKGIKHMIDSSMTSDIQSIEGGSQIESMCNGSPSMVTPANTEVNQVDSGPPPFLPQQHANSIADFTTYDALNSRVSSTLTDIEYGWQNMSVEMLWPEFPHQVLLNMQHAGRGIPNHDPAFDNPI
ncbi:transcriptional regulator family: Fungal Specific TF [Trichoderma aggressivum f. europaeum]|uniref:Transcriptional regulator family: Fungal Specific TF n=1 Tax=Trichoderma aggressivum f. europaeum TaxID=173218 RepID=A0AAE1IIT8_9HYPO|nr:transcriptional regulator family: Fungal Specific TF [Trichoderma aggressivum f. europaeum]